MLDFDKIVDDYYQPLYRFALSLAKQEGDAADLVQQTFALWARHGHQLRDESKVKTWLFTTLRREFLATIRRSARYSDEPLPEDGEETALTPAQAEEIDAATVLEKLQQLPLEYREPLTLFYLKQTSYAEIAGILDLPIGTVMSRLSRAKSRLRKLLTED
jgi:RNA polymerase sigma-70 factor (ECF subfamily)